MATLEEYWIKHRTYAPSKIQLKLFVIGNVLWMNKQILDFGDETLHYQTPRQWSLRQMYLNSIHSELLTRFKLIVVSTFKFRKVGDKNSLSKEKGTSSYDTKRQLRELALSE